MDHRPPLQRNSTPPLYRNTPPRNYAPSPTRDPRDHLRSAERSTESQLSHVDIIKSMQDMQATLRALNKQIEQMKVRSSSSNRRHHPSNSPLPRSEVPHQEHVLHRRISPEASQSASSLFKQLEMKSIEATTPAPVFQDPVHQSKAVEEISVQHIQEFKDPVAAQMFDGMLQPSVKANDDAGSKNQKPVVNSNVKLIDCAVEEVLVRKVQQTQDHSFQVDKEESSYFLEIGCKLELVSFTPVAAQWVDLIRKDGEEMERIGVG